MRLLSTVLVALTTLTGLPAAAQPGAAPVEPRETRAWPGLGSPLAPPFQPQLAQAERDPEADQARIDEIDREIAELSQKIRDTSLTGPIVVTSVGLGLLGTGGLTALLVHLACEDAKSDPTMDCNEDNADTLLIVFGIVAATGGVMAIAGGATWGSRRSRRGPWVEEHRRLRQERRTLSNSLASLRLGSRVSGGNRILTVGFEF